MILVDKQPTAMAIWEQAFGQNPGGFEKIAQDQSMDSASRSLAAWRTDHGHAYPQPLSDAAFHQLVDGDPLDKDPTHKPKDGDFTGPIQVNESVWGVAAVSRSSRRPRELTIMMSRFASRPMKMIYEVKLKEAMADVFRELIKGSEIENMLTGTSQAGQRGERTRRGQRRQTDVTRIEREGIRDTSECPCRVGRRRTIQTAAARRIVRRSRQTIRQDKSAVETWRQREHHHQQSQW